MNCSGVRKRLVEYVEAELGLRGALPVPEQLEEALEAHLARCARCREEAAAIRNSLTVANMADEVQATAHFKAKTVRLLKQEAERVRGVTPFAFRLRPAFAYLATVLVLGILLVIFLPQRAERVELAADTTEFEQQVDQCAREIQLLADTLSGSDYESASYVERAQLDRIVMLDRSVDECWEAYGKNPENTRIRTLLLAQMREEVDALKSFYEVRSL